MKFFGKDKKNAKILIKGVPFEFISPSGGCALSPYFLRYCSEYIETKSFYFNKECEDFEDKGDISCFGIEFIEAIDLIERESSEILESGKMVLFIGGDHTISYPIFKSVKNIYPDVKLLIFDAHTDFRDLFMDSKLNHATWLKRLYEERVIREDEVFLYGIRENFPETPFKILKKEELLELKGNFYLSFDLDVFKPEFFSSVTNPVPGGLSFEEVMEILNRIKNYIVSADFVEFNPLRGNPLISGTIFATLIREFIVLKSL
ncbi:MAG: arginase family protein [candidate division WOR-3 bacterium]